MIIHYFLVDPAITTREAAVHQRVLLVDRKLLHDSFHILCHSFVNSWPILVIFSPKDSVQKGLCDDMSIIFEN